MAKNKGEIKYYTKGQAMAAFFPKSFASKFPDYVCKQVNERLNPQSNKL